MAGRNEFIRKINIRFDMMDEAHAAVLWKLDEESGEKKISRNRLILQHLFTYYQQKESEEKDAGMAVTKEYVDGKISALKCEMLEEILQVITGNMQENSRKQIKEEETQSLLETDSMAGEKTEADIFSDPVIMAAAQKWG